MRRSQYGNPADVLERKQESGCHGCAHAMQIFGVAGCEKGKRYGRRCKSFTGKRAMTLEDRLQNWARVVRSPRFKDGTCALWAQWYVMLRDRDSREPAAHITRDERDAWDVERAWQRIPNEVTKTLLKCWYVQNMGEEALQTTMRRKHGARIRRELIPFALQNAQRDISRELLRLLPVVSNIGIKKLEVEYA